MTEPDKVCLDRTVTNFTPDSLAQYQNSVVRIKDFIRACSHFKSEISHS